MSKPLLAPIKLVAFDYDDTLVGTREVVWRMHKHIAKTHYGVDLTDEDILVHWGKPIAELGRALYQTSDAVTATSRMLQYGDTFRKEQFASTAPTLRYLKSIGKKLAIVTATVRPILVQDCAHVGLPLEIVDYVQTSEDTSVHKPDPKVFEPLLKWAAAHDITPQEILYIGDGLQDMRAANAAGFAFLGVTTGLITAEEFASFGAATISNLRELIVGKR